MTPAGHGFRQIGAYGTDNRRFYRVLIVSLVLHGVLAWLLMYHLEQFIPPHPPQAYLVELLSPVVSVPELPSVVAEEISLPEASPEPLPVPPVKALPKPVPIKPPPQQLPVTPPPPPPPSVVTPKTPPDLAPPQSLQPKVQRTTTAQPQLNDTATPRSLAQRDVALTTPDMTKPQARRLDNVASLPAAQNTLPSIRRNQDVVDTPRATPNYQTSRQPVQSSLPDQSGGLVPTTSSRGDVDVPDSLQRRVEPRAPRSESSLPMDRGQQLAARSGETAITAPRGPAVAMTKGSSTRGNESLPVSSPGFSPATGSNTSVPMPGSTTPSATSGRSSRLSPSSSMPSDKTPILAASSQTTVDQDSLKAFRNLKTCLDTEQEKRLKIRLATLLEGDATCTSGNIRFLIAATETEQTLQVGIAGAGQFKDRCDALQQAVRCIEQSGK